MPFGCLGYMCVQWLRFLASRRPIHDHRVSLSLRKRDLRVCVCHLATFHLDRSSVAPLPSRQSWCTGRRSAGCALHLRECNIGTRSGASKRARPVAHRTSHRRHRQRALSKRLWKRGARSAASRRRPPLPLLLNDAALGALSHPQMREHRLRPSTTKRRQQLVQQRGVDRVQRADHRANAA